MSIVLYTTGCPRCKCLEKRLDEAGIKYETNTDIDIMRDKGFTTVPVMEVDGETLVYSEALNWVIKNTKN